LSMNSFILPLSMQLIFRSYYRTIGDRGQTVETTGSGLTCFPP
jgi:hypothetical protein